MAVRKILLINGPNLDMLGMREPDVYGTQTLASLEESAVMYAYGRGLMLTCFQSNSEAELIDTVHDAAGHYDGIVFSVAESNNVWRDD